MGADSLPSFYLKGGFLSYKHIFPNQCITAFPPIDSLSIFPVHIKNISHLMKEIMIFKDLIKAFENLLFTLWENTVKIAFSFPHQWSKSNFGIFKETNSDMYYEIGTSFARQSANGDASLIDDFNWSTADQEVPILIGSQLRFQSQPLNLFILLFSLGLALGE